MNHTRNLHIKAVEEPELLAPEELEAARPFLAFRELFETIDVEFVVVELDPHDWPAWTDAFVWELTEPEPTIAEAPATVDQAEVPAPVDGRSLWSWLQRMGARHSVGLLRATRSWGRSKGYPERVLDWTEPQVAEAHARAVASLGRATNLEAAYRAAYYSAGRAAGDGAAL